MNNYNDYNIIGSDETGVGDYLSPIVACAVFINKDQKKYLQDIGIKDSKLLSDKKIAELASIIKSKVSYSIAHFSQKGYNNLNKFYNAHEIKMFLHLKAINYLEKKHNNVDYVIIDAFASDKNINIYENKLIKASFGLEKIINNKIILEKAESFSLAVACASIIARNFFNLKMEEQNQKYGLKFPLGTNLIVESFAKKFVEIYGQEALYEVAKIKFKTTLKLFPSFK